MGFLADFGDKTVIGTEARMKVAAGGVRSHVCGRVEVGLDAAQREVHDGEAGGGGEMLNE